MEYGPHPFILNITHPLLYPRAQMLSWVHARVIPRITRSFAASGTSVGKNYFQVLGVPQQFDVDIGELATRFKTLQRDWHPDRHASGKTGTDPTKAANVSALLNEAYNALRTPHTRANHLLSILGEDDEPEMDPEFLAWVVEYREKIADAESDCEQISQLKVEVGRICENCLETLGDSFDNNRLEEAAKHSAKLRYLWRMSNALHEMS